MGIIHANVATSKFSSSPKGLSTSGVQGPAVITIFLVLKIPLGVLRVMTCPGMISVTGVSSRNTPPADAKSFCKNRGLICTLPSSSSEKSSLGKHWPLCLPSRILLPFRTRKQCLKVEKVVSNIAHKPCKEEIDKLALQIYKESCNTSLAESFSCEILLMWRLWATSFTASLCSGPSITTPHFLVNKICC